MATGRTPRTPRTPGTSTREPSPGIAALRARRAQRQSAREEFYGKYGSATERRQARQRGESPRVQPKPTNASSYRFNRGQDTEETSQAQAVKPSSITDFNPMRRSPLGPSPTPSPTPSAAPSRGAPAGVPAEDWAAATAAGSKRGVDPKLLAAIAAHETGFGKLGQGRRGLTLGVGAYDSGAVDTWAGKQTQYEKAAELLSKWGAKNLSDVLAGKAAKYATDPGWESKVANWYNRL